MRWYGVLKGLQRENLDVAFPVCQKKVNPSGVAFVVGERTQEVECGFPAVARFGKGFVARFEVG